MIIEEIRTKYLNKYGYGYFNKLCAENEYTRFLENEIIEFSKFKNNVSLDCVSHRFPANPEILEWWKTQNFQKEVGEQEYTMIFEIDLPKILKAFTEYLLNDA